MLLVATYRPSDAEALNPPLKRGVLDLRTAGLADELPLGPLAVPDVRAWLDARFSPNDFPAGLAEALHARAEGLPLFVRALVELLEARGEIRRGEKEWGLARPLAELDLEPSKDVKDLVRAQLESLPAADRDLLEAASVVGKEFSSPVVAALAGRDALDVEERLLRLSRVQRVLESLGDEELPDGALGTRYRFAHGLFQRVLYDDLVAPRRAQLHRRTAELLTRHWGEDAPMLAVQVAEHFELGRDVASAARFRTRAGDHATRRFAAAEADEQYTCALRLVEKLPPAERGAQEIGLLEAARDGEVRAGPLRRRRPRLRGHARAGARGPVPGRRVRRPERPQQRALLRPARLGDRRARPRGARGGRAGGEPPPPVRGARPGRAGPRGRGPARRGRPRPGRRHHVRAGERRRVGARDGPLVPRLRALLAQRVPGRGGPRARRDSSSRRSSGTPSRPSPRGCSRASPASTSGASPRPSPTSSRPSPWPSATGTRSGGPVS